MSIPTTDWRTRLRFFLYRHGQDPKLSWRRFQLGLGLFVLGVLALFAGAKVFIWLQIPAVLLMATGMGCAFFGYFGMLANRLSHGISRVRRPSFEDNRNSRLK